MVPGVAWVLAGLCTIGAGFMLAFGPAGANPTTTLDWAALLLFGLLPASFAITSAAILSKQPRNAVGWVLMVPAVSFVASALIQSFFAGFDPAPTALDWWHFPILMFENFSWVLLIFPLFQMMLIFPDGHLLSRRWLSVVALEGLLVSVMVALSVFSAEIGPQEIADWMVPNPIGFVPIDIFDGLFAIAWAVGLFAVTLGSVLALIVRFRRSGPVARQQIKWVLVAVVFFGVVYITAAAFSGFVVGGLADTLLALSINLLPVAIAVGVLKYRLFDIDRFVSRTVGYALVIGLLALVYLGVAIWLPSRFLSGDSPLFVAGATLTVAALFNPVRRSVLRWVDRRFYRSRYDMELLVEKFGIRLQNQTDVDGLTSDWVGVVTESLQPSAVGVWIKR